MFDPSSTDNDWNFQKPVKCVLTDKKKLFALKKPYTGPFAYSTTLQMTSPPNHLKFKRLAALEKIVIPNNFSWRKRGKDQVEQGGLRNQKMCGGCWAFATASALGDRVALKNQLKSPYLSPAWIISEASNILNQPHQGCEGGNVQMTSQFFEVKENGGVKLEQCWPFEIISDGSKYGGPELGTGQAMLAPDSLNVPDLSQCCFNCCGDDVKNESSFRVTIKEGSTKYFGVTLDSFENYTQQSIDKIIRDIQVEIMSNGPVTTSFAVFSDFMEYYGSKPDGTIDPNSDAAQGKVYIHTRGSFTGGHAVVITGWGIDENGTKYWEIRNSWGLAGDKGYFKALMSNMSNQDNWCGFDIPLTQQGGQYFGGVISFLPDDIPNLEDLFKQGVLEKSSFGNLITSNPTDDNDGTITLSSSHSILVYVLLILIIVILITLSVLYYNGYF